MAISLDEVMASLSPTRRALVEARAKEIIEEERARREARSAKRHAKAEVRKTSTQKAGQGKA